MDEIKFIGGPSVVQIFFIAHVEILPRAENSWLLSLLKFVRAIDKKIKVTAVQMWKIS